jgi:hypothetical protein
MVSATEDTSMFEQIEEVKCAIRKLSFVTILSPVLAVKGKGQGYGSCLTCYRCKEHDRSGKKQEPPVHVSGEHPMELACLKELIKRLQDRHVECAQAVAKKAAADAQVEAAVSPDTPNVLQEMMQLEQAKTRAKAANKLALEVEKEKDAAEKAVEKLKRRLQPKRSHTHYDDVGVPRHYARRSYRCWCMVCSRVRGRGHGSKSCGANLVVEGCTRTKQTFWTEDQFVVTASSGIRDRDTRIAEIVARELQKGQTWEVGMRTGFRTLVMEGGDTRVSWTPLAAEVWEGCWKR